jgi:heme oxygenase
MTAYPSARAYLRGVTSNQHTRLDAVASAVALHTARGYAQFLSTQASVVIPLERALEQGGIERVLPDWQSRRRSDALRADLADLHSTFSPHDVSDFHGDAALLGAAYVLEGTRLGARIVVKQIGAHAPRRFLRHGEELRLWQRFVETLEACPEVRNCPERAGESACQVFSLFLDAMAPREMVAA